MENNPKKSKAFIITFVLIVILLIAAYLLFKNKDTLFGTKSDGTINKIFSPLLGTSKNKNLDVITGGDSNNSNGLDANGNPINSNNSNGLDANGNPINSNNSNGLDANGNPIDNSNKNIIRPSFKPITLPTDLNNNINNNFNNNNYNNKYCTNGATDYPTCKNFPNKKYCTNGATDYPTCKNFPANNYISVVAMSPYKIKSGDKKISFYYSVSPSTKAECRLLDYEEKPISGDYGVFSTKNVSPIKYTDLSTEVGDYAYYVECRNSVNKEVKTISNEIDVSITTGDNFCANKAINPTDCNECADGSTVNEGGVCPSISVVAASPYTNIAGNTSVNFSYTTIVTGKNAKAECRLLDYEEKPISGDYGVFSTKNSSPIKYTDLSTEVGDYAYYVECRNSISEKTIAKSNEIDVAITSPDQGKEVCENGATNPSECSVCSDGNAVPESGVCPTICTNGATDYPNCTSCPNGESVTSEKINCSDDTKTNICLNIDKHPIMFTEEEKAKLSELLRKFYILAPDLKTEDDIVLAYNDIDKYKELISQIEDLTQKCFDQTNPATYRGPTIRHGNPWYNPTDRGSYVYYTQTPDSKNYIAYDNQPTKGKCTYSFNSHGYNNNGFMETFCPTMRTKTDCEKVTPTNIQAIKNHEDKWTLLDLIPIYNTINTIWQTFFEADDMAFSITGCKWTPNESEDLYNYEVMMNVW